jgi:FtsH-binding integral membrane protein
MAFASSRPIPGAVATAGVSDRVAFLRRTYAHLGLALVAWAVASAGLFIYLPKLSFTIATFGGVGGFGIFLGIALFIGAGYLAQRLAMSESSRALQYVGLALEVTVFTALVQSFLWAALMRLGGDPSVFASTVAQAGIITVVIFVGLTATVFITKKDFSFMRGALTIGIFAVFGVSIASLIFGFQLGALFSGAVILLMAGYVLYETSTVMAHFPPTHHVAAALMLFSTVATMFMHILRLLSILRGDD